MDRPGGSESEVDLLALEVTRARLQAIADEAGATVVRTAFSVVISEAKDFACAILTPDCSTIAQSTQGIPVFLSTMTETAKHLVSAFPLGEWRPGDVYATNDPWLGTGHLYDVTLVSPIILGNEVVALSAVVGHLPDIGGRIVGTSATQCFEEGLRLPPMRLVREGKLDSATAAILRANVRMPDEVLGDLDALLNAGAVMSDRLVDLIGMVGLAQFRKFCDELERRVESAMRSAIAELPDGVYESRMESEVAGMKFVICLTAKVNGDQIFVDFAETSDQLPAGINACLNYTSGYVVSALKTLLTPGVPFNGGTLRPIHITAPEASILNSTFPAPGAARHSVGHFIPGQVFKALAGVLPKQTIGECGSPRPSMRLSGIRTDTGALFTAPVFNNGGFGARAEKDGISCIAFPTNASTIAVEIMESSAPILFEEKQLLVDSGGAGKYRGGLGQRITVRALMDGIRASIVAQRLRVPPAGVHGGGDGSLARVLLDGEEISILSDPIRLNAGARITLDSPGGGGYGDPRERDRRLVEDDIADGYVSLDSAARTYLSK